MFARVFLGGPILLLKLLDGVKAKLPTKSTPTKMLQPSEEAATATLTEIDEHIVDTSREQETKPPTSPDHEWWTSIENLLDQARQNEATGSWGKLSIYRVPHHLRDSCSKAYVPQLVSLGPYHRGNESLKPMESHKWRALHRVLRRTNRDLHFYVDCVKKLEEKARACYEGPINMSSNEFVVMLVLDGFFVLELFRGHAEGFHESLGYRRDDPIFATRETLHYIRRDMIMLENQIPFFVLDRLLALQLVQPERKGRVAKLAFEFFNSLKPTDKPLPQQARENSAGGPRDVEANDVVIPGYEKIFDPLLDRSGLHSLDVFRRSLLRPGPQAAQRKYPTKDWSDKRFSGKRHQLLRSVTELKTAGILFKEKKTGRFCDVEFINGMLWIPKLLIDDVAKSLFVNLIAFEQCHLECKNDITLYIIFMDNLINSAKDVEHLRNCGIIEHSLGSDAEVADLFNNLCQEVVLHRIDDEYVSGLLHRVNQYYNHSWKASLARLGHYYLVLPFDHPWAVVSVAAAAVLLLLTFVQTFYGVYEYYRPPSLKGSSCSTMIFTLKT